MGKWGSLLANHTHTDIPASTSGTQALSVSKMLLLCLVVATHMLIAHDRIWSFWKGLVRRRLQVGTGNSITCFRMWTEKSKQLCEAHFECARDTFQFRNQIRISIWEYRPFWKSSNPHRHIDSNFVESLICWLQHSVLWLCWIATLCWIIIPILRRENDDALNTEADV